MTSMTEALVRADAASFVHSYKHTLPPQDEVLVIEILMLKLMTYYHHGRVDACDALLVDINGQKAPSVDLAASVAVE